SFARNNSDLFYLLISYKKKEELLQKISNIISDIDYQITDFKIILSIGIYMIVDRNMSARKMADRADLARRSVKNKNESSYSFFDVDMLSQVREEKEIENVMEQALETREFKVYYQPKVSLDDENKIVGAEALVRWIRDGKVIPPGRFIPLFEKNHFVLRLDMYVFEEVCIQQKHWMNMGRKPFTISVNMSRVHLQDAGFVGKLAEICRRYGVPPEIFEIEITESAAFENLDVLERVFRELKEYGFHISIDDFGTGYSSLNMLKNLPVDVLKIDREFLSGAEENQRACDIIAHVISLAVALNMKTISEGIETEEQAQLLTKLGCNMAQGFYFARPVPVEEFEKRAYGGTEEGTK
ncbi:MAG: putative bifunctional diguanylate cyclase/phosphodiesterase, partial [Ruminiclostridium sp.]